MKEKRYDLSVAIKGRVGRGAYNYTNHGTIPKYNLSNWKWVTVMSDDKDFDCTISLNMVDMDKVTGNFHALYDRIGFIISSKKYSYTKKICTSIDLPLENKDMERIYEKVIEEYKQYTNNSKSEND